MKFSIKNFFSKFDQIWKKVRKEILNGKFHFLCSALRLRKTLDTTNPVEDQWAPFENTLIDYQISKNFQHIVTQYHSGFEKGFNAIYFYNYLLVIIEKITKVLNEVAEYAVFFTDLSKSFDCLSHLIIAKLYAYSFDRNSSKLIHSYLSERYQRFNSCSDWRLIR